MVSQISNGHSSAQSVPTGDGHPGGSLDTRTVFAVLASHHLLREAVVDGRVWTLDADRIPFLRLGAITYDSRQSGPSSLLFCKGDFKDEYMVSADRQGLACYVSEKEYGRLTRSLGFIVSDVRKAMALLSAEFYGHPERRMSVIGITGTKGKTTTAYLLHAILRHYSGNRCAIIGSALDNIDGRHWIKTSLTTPESPDLFALMRAAFDNGMRYFVMEVSSQALKIDRVYGITFDVGAFLNISPDHISPKEHPTFEDYFYCKRRLVFQSRRFLYNADLGDNSRLIADAARLAGIPAATFGMDPDRHPTFLASPVDERAAREGSSFGMQRVVPGTDRRQAVGLGTFHLALPGSFNYQNALAAVGLALMAGVPPTDTASLHALETVTVPGRMERTMLPDGTAVIVDYAHNYASFRAVLTFARRHWAHSRITVVTGSSGGKALDRREGMGKAVSELGDRLITTTDDAAFEDPKAIADQIMAAVDNPAVEKSFVPDRQEAIRQAVCAAHEDRVEDPGCQPVVLVLGKGDEPWIEIRGKKVPMTADSALIASLAHTDAGR